MQSPKHITAGITAFLIWGFFVIPLRALSDFTAGQILYFRILFSLIILAVILFGFRRKSLKEGTQLLSSFPARKRNAIIMLTLGGGLLLTVNWLTFIYVVNQINIKTASFSYLICPVLTAVLGSVLLQEKLSRQQWVAVLLCALSCILIGMGSVLELGFSVLIAITYALYLISQRRNQGFDRILVLGVQVLFAFIVLSSLLPLLVAEVPDNGNFYALIIVVAGVFTVLPLFLNLFALNKVDAATIGIVMYLNPIMNFTIAVLFYGEKLGFVQSMGYLTILIALVLFNYQTIKRFVNR